MPCAISEKEELLQRVYIRLKVKRGSFPYDPKLGSCLYEISQNKGSQAAAMAFVEEALGRDCEATITDTTISDIGITVTVSTVYGSGTVTV